MEYCFQVLIENGADVDVKGADDYRPLHYASRAGSVEVVKVPPVWRLNEDWHVSWECANRFSLIAEPRSNRRTSLKKLLCTKQHGMDA